MIVDLTKDECERILAENRYGHLGCCDGDEPYVIPVTYVYRDGLCYGYTHAGRKVEVLRKNPKMCLQVEKVESAGRWESVVCWGNFEEVTDEKNIRDVKLLFADQHGTAILSGQQTPVSPLVEDVHLIEGKTEAIVYRMLPYRMTGRAERS